MAADRDPIEELADEFMTRCRNGERPSVDDYVRAHPELADEIRDLFPTIAALEQAKSSHSHSPGLGIAGDVDRTHLGDYRLIREIGRGGMGIVYEAEQESLGRRVALKVLPRRILSDAKQTDRFEREARTAAKLHHTNIVPIFGVGEQDGYHYYVMQLIRGIGLDQVFRELTRAARSRTEAERSSATPRGLTRAQGLDVIDLGRELAADLSTGSASASAWSGSMATQPLTEGDCLPTPSPDDPTDAEQAPEQAMSPRANADDDGNRTIGVSHWRSVARIGLQVADALAYAHSQGTLHRDIKPGNLLLDVDGTVWVADFGLAKGVDQAAITQPGDLVGTLRYMAPEQFQGQADERSDIYSLGITLRELATLQPAFSAETRGELIKAIMRGETTTTKPPRVVMPRDLETVLLKATASEPEHRYATAAEFEEDLRRFLEDRPVLARRIGPVERAWRWAQRNPVLAGLTASVAALLLLVAVLASAGYVHTRLANERVLEALARTESVSRIALDALDTVFDEFAPRQTTAVFSASVGDSNDAEQENVSVAVAPVLSKETAALLESLLPYYDQLAKVEGASENLAPKIAEANVRVGDIHQQLGQHDKARTAYQRAADLYATHTEKTLPRRETQLALAQIDNKMGRLLHAMHRPDEGRNAFVAAYDRLNAISDATPETRLELARTCYLLARPHRPPLPGPAGPEGLGRRGPRREGGPPHPPFPPPAGAQEGHPPPPHDSPHHEDETQPEHGAYLREAVTILEELIRQAPDRADFHRLLAKCYCEWPPHEPLPPARQGQNPRDLGIVMLEQLVERHPDVPDYRFDLSLAYLSEPPMPPLLRTRDDKGEERFARARTILEELVAARPDVSDYALALVHTYFRIGTRKARQGDFDQAEADLRAALELLRTLTGKSPEQTTYHIGACLVQVALAETLLAKEQTDDGVELLEDALASIHSLPADDDKAVPHLDRLERHVQRLLRDPEAPARRPGGLRHILRRAGEAIRGHADQRDRRRHPPRKALPGSDRKRPPHKPPTR